MLNAVSKGPAGVPEEALWSGNGCAILKIVT